MNILCIADIHFGKINNEEEMYNKGTVSDRNIELGDES